MIGERRDRTPVRGAERSRRDALLNVGRQLQQAERVRHGRATLPHAIGDLLVRRAEVVDELTEGRSLFQGVQVDALQVLDQRVAQHLIVAGLTDDRGDASEAGETTRTPPALPCHELVASVDRAHDDRLEQTDGPDGCGEFPECIVVDRGRRLAGVWSDLIDRDVAQLRAAGDDDFVRQQRR